MIRKGCMEQIDYFSLELRTRLFGCMKESMQNVPERKNGMNSGIVLAIMCGSVEPAFCFA